MNKQATPQSCTYWQWKKKIPAEVCELLIKEAQEEDFETAAISSENTIDPKIRNAKIQFLEINHWFEGVMMNHARYANESAGWGYKFNTTEPIQIAKYEKDEFYDWHQDCYLPGVPKAEIRKLSIVALLSDPKDFEGSGLFIDGVDENLLVNQGDLVVFPSYFKHQVKPVVVGTRVSAVAWVRGPSFI